MTAPRFYGKVKYTTIKAKVDKLRAEAMAPGTPEGVQEAWRELEPFVDVAFTPDPVKAAAKVLTDAMGKDSLTEQLMAFACKVERPVKLALANFAGLTNRRGEDVDPGKAWRAER